MDGDATQMKSPETMSGRFHLKADWLQGVTDRAQLAQEQRNTEQVESIARQVDAGRCDVIPFPKVATQPFRSWLTVEKTPVFVANSFDGDHRTYERQLTHPESGEPVFERITVGKVHEQARPLGVLRQSHQEVFYKLLKLWGDNGYEVIQRGSLILGVLGTDEHPLTAYDLVTYLRGNNSEKHYQRVQELLRELAAIPIVREQGYTSQGRKDRIEFTLLAGVSWREKNLDQGTRRPEIDGTSRVTVFFSELITEGFLRKDIKQLLLTPYEELGRGKYGRRGEIARLLYPLLDHELAGKNEYHCRLAELARRLGIAAYTYPSKRREKFLPAVQLLNGKLIQGEKYKLRVTLEATEDAKDYKLVARRESAQLELTLSNHKDR